MTIFYTYLLTVPVMFAFDLLWLGVFAKDFYNKALSPILTIQFNFPAVILFYLLYIVGIFFFAVYPGVMEQNLQKTLVYAALFGFFCYMTYDLTSLATVKDWPVKLVIVDLIWGTVLSTFTAYVAYNIYFWLK